MVETELFQTHAIQELTKLGYTYDTRAPQLGVSFFVQVTDRADVRSTPATGFRPWAGILRDIETIGYKAATLRIGLVDAARSASVWQGVAEGKIPEEALHNPGPRRRRGDPWHLPAISRHDPPVVPGARAVGTVAQATMSTSFTKVLGPKT